VLSGTPFEHFYMPFRHLIWLAYLWLARMPMHGLKVACPTEDEALSRWTKTFLGVVADGAARNGYQGTGKKIGGRRANRKRIIVEVDEKKFGKRKFNMGRRVEGVTCVVGVERMEDDGENPRWFAFPIGNKSAHTLFNVLLQHVHPESILLTDMLASYDVPGKALFEAHYRVCHKREFVDFGTVIAELPEDLAHINTVEGKNSGLARMIPKQAYNQEKILDHFFAIQWRQMNRKDV